MANTVDQTVIPIGFLNKVIIINCAITPMIVLEAAAAAALSLFISFEEPNVKEVIKSVTGGSWLHNIREYMYEADLVEAEIESYGIRALFELAEALDALVWWIFVAELIGEFLLAWESQIWKIAGCVPNPSEYWVDGKDAETVFVPDGTWRAGCLFYGCQTNQGIRVDVGYQHTLREHDEVTLICAQLFGDVSNNPQRTNQRILNDSTGAQIDYSGTFSGLDRSNWGAINMVQKLNGAKGDTSLSIWAMNEDPTPLIEFFAFQGHFYYSRLTFPDE